MTYKSIVNSIKEIVDRHYFLKEFGYGNLSDIKTNIETGSTTDYPYAFLNPQTHSRTERMVTYRFNLIVMEMALKQDQLQAQSDCMQYIDDILAEIKYTFENQFDIDINVPVVPFVERFQDEVAGATATIEIQVPTILNLCIAPIEPGPGPGPEPDPFGELIVDVYTRQDQLFRPDLAQSPVNCLNWLLNDGNWRAGAPSNYYEPKDQDKYTFVFEGVARVTVVDPVVPFNPFILDQRQLGIPTNVFINADVIEGWPTDPQVGDIFQFKYIWKDRVHPNGAPGNTNFWAVNIPNTPDPEGQFFLWGGSNIKIYKKP